MVASHPLATFAKGSRTMKIRGQDMVAKKRYTMPRRKLSDEQVNYARSQKGIKSSKQLAEEFGISYWSVKHLWSGRTYSLIPPPPSDIDRGE
jgi:hypothetical protein